MIFYSRIDVYGNVYLIKWQMWEFSEGFQSFRTRWFCVQHRATENLYRFFSEKICAAIFRESLNEK